MFFFNFDVDKFGKTRRHHSKELLKISKTAKFESDLLKAYKDTAPQSRENLQTFATYIGVGRERAIYRLCQSPFLPVYFDRHQALQGLDNNFFLAEIPSPC